MQIHIKTDHIVLTINTISMIIYYYNSNLKVKKKRSSPGKGEKPGELKERKEE